MIKQSRPEIVAQLKAKGVKFLEFKLVQEGNYLPEDAEWNYKDIPHLNYVHKTIRDTSTVVGDDIHAYINLQKVFGFRFPFAVFVYQNAPHVLTYYTTVLCFIIVIDSTYQEVSPQRTRVTTFYSLGAPKIFFWGLPLLRWWITRNYAFLMKKDVAIRERRGQLRQWGYTFAQRFGQVQFKETLDITKSHVIFPKNYQSQLFFNVDVHKVLPSDGQYFLGKNDHLGLRLVRISQRLLVYPRLCPHEGASLDSERCSQDEKITCPWHGRTFAPLASFDLNQAASQTYSTPYHTAVFSKGALQVEMKKPVTSGIG